MPLLYACSSNFDVPLLWIKFLCVERSNKQILKESDSVNMLNKTIPAKANPIYQTTLSVKTSFSTVWKFPSKTSQLTSKISMNIFNDEGGHNSNRGTIF